MNKNICDSKNKIVPLNMNDLKVSNTITVRKKSASDILTDQIPVKKERIKSVDENVEFGNVKRRQTRIIKRRLASTSRICKNQETSQTQNVNTQAIRKPLMEVSNNLIFHQTTNKKTTKHFPKQANPISSVSNIALENVFQNTSQLPQILHFSSLKNENLELKQMKDTSSTDKKGALKQIKGSTFTNEYQINKCKQSVKDEVTGDFFCSSSSVYIDDIIEYLFSREASMNEFSRVDNMANSHTIFKIVINHLILLQEFFKSSCTTVFLTAKIYEFYTNMVTVNPAKASVVMLTSYWLASKYNDCGSTVTCSDLISITSYKRAELLHFERDILSTLNFNVDFPEPLTFSEYYFFHLGFRDSTVMPHCVNYMIHCFLLNRWYFTYKHSKIAAAAVRLTLHYFKSMDEDSLNKCWAKLYGRPAYYDASELIDVEQEMMDAVETMQDPDFKFRQAFKKFSEKKYMSVSKKLLKMTAATSRLHT